MILASLLFPHCHQLSCHHTIFIVCILISIEYLYCMYYHLCYHYQMLLTAMA